LLPSGAPVVNYPKDLPPRAELPDVPFFPQEKYQCGPAALAMAVSSAGVARTPEQFVNEVYLPQREGSLQSEMLAATRRAGLIAYPLSPNLGAVLQEVADGHPVVVMQNLRFDFLPLWHYAVVVGFDQEPGEVILRSGTTERLIENDRRFDSSWTKAGRWAFVALPPGQLPATVEQDRYVLAAAALERVSPQGARDAYTAALARWPDNLVAQMGLGNIAYASHDLAQAETQYRLATEEHPDSADAWNNLAQVLHELGRNEQALTAAQRALSIGGPRQELYRATLQEIDSSSAQ